MEGEKILDVIQVKNLLLVDQMCSKVKRWGRKQRRINTGPRSFAVVTVDEKAENSVCPSETHKCQQSRLTVTRVQRSAASPLPYNSSAWNHEGMRPIDQVLPSIDLPQTLQLDKKSHADRNWFEKCECEGWRDWLAPNVTV